MSDFYRPCASAVVFNKKGLILLGNRIDTIDDAWQFSQGGIEKGETPEIASKRELFEEMNVQSVQLIAVDKTPIKYDFPKNVKEKFYSKNITTKGQEIYFALFFFTGEEQEINVKTQQPEFKDYKWDTFDFAIQNIVSFKKEAYVSVANRFIPIITQYLQKLS